MWKAISNLFLFSLIVADLSAGDNLCTGQITDKNNHPRQALALPAVGVLTNDPSGFNGKFRRVTDVAATHTTGDAFIKPMYSPVDAFNADESRFVLYAGTGAGSLSGWPMYDGTTYAYIRNLAVSPADVEQLWWDATDPLYIYWPSASAQLLMKTNVETNSSTVLHDFTGTCQGQWLYGESHVGASWDGDLFGFACGGLAISWRKSTNTTHTSTAFQRSPEGYSARPIPLPSGTGFIMMWQTNANQYPWYVDVVNEDFSLRTLTTHMPGRSSSLDIYAASHFSMGKDAAGNDILVMIAFDPGLGGSPVGQIVEFKISDGSSHAVVSQSNGYRYPWGSSHISGTARQNQGWIWSSVTGGCDSTTWCPGSEGIGTAYQGLNAPVQPIGADLLDNELFITNVDTNQTCRITHARSYGKLNTVLNNSYWAEAHVTSSRTGCRALFASDWLGTQYVDTYVVELPCYGANSPLDIITTSLPSGTTGVAYSQQISVTGGTTPYTACDEIVGSLPTGLASDPNASGCLIHGTPSGSGTSNFTEQVTDSAAGTDSQALSITINTVLSIDTASLPNGNLGSSYSQQIAISGGVHPYTACDEISGSLPTGLDSTPNASGCLISGIPLTIGTFNFTERVTDTASATDTQAYSITINGSSIVALSYSITPGHNYAFVTMGGVGLDYNSTCSIDLRNDVGTVIDTKNSTSGPARRNIIFTGLSASSQYGYIFSCNGAQPDNNEYTFSTRATPSGGNRTIPINFGSPRTGITRVTVDYGTPSGQSCTTSDVGVGSVQNTSCSSGCTVNLTLAAGLYCYRHRWQDSSNNVLATGLPQFLQVQ